MGGMVFLGFFIGTLLGSLGDIYGRLVMLKFSTFMMAIGGLLSAFAPEFYSFLL
jgi:MFS family permease